MGIFKHSPDPFNRIGALTFGLGAYNLTGDYIWHANRRVVKGHFRPLRQPREAAVG
jgi:hypothetical protein